MKKYFRLIIVGVLVSLVCIGIVMGWKEIDRYKHNKESILLDIKTYWSYVEEKHKGGTPSFETFEAQADLILHQMDQMTTFWVLYDAKKSRIVDSSVDLFMNLHYDMSELYFLTEKKSVSLTFLKLQESYEQIQNSMETWPSLGYLDSIFVAFFKSNKTESLQRRYANIEAEYLDFEKLLLQCFNGEKVPFRDMDIARRSLQKEVAFTVASLDKRKSKSIDAVQVCATLYDEVDILWKDIECYFYLDGQKKKSLDDLFSKYGNIEETKGCLMRLAKNHYN